MDLVLYAVFFALIGARLYYVAFQWDYYKEDLFRILQVREGGLAIYGGVIGGLIAARATARKHNISMLTILDIVSVSVMPCTAKKFEAQREELLKRL